MILIVQKYNIINQTHLMLNNHFSEQNFITYKSLLKMSCIPIIYFPDVEL